MPNNDDGGAALFVAMFPGEQDPVHQHETDPAHEWGKGLGWFFYDETGAYDVGPYESARAAREALYEYAANL